MGVWPVLWVSMGFVGFLWFSMGSLGCSIVFYWFSMGLLLPIDIKFSNRNTGLFNRAISNGGIYQTTMSMATQKNRHRAPVNSPMSGMSLLWNYLPCLRRKKRMIHPQTRFMPFIWWSYRVGGFSKKGCNQTPGDAPVALWFPLVNYE